MKSSRDCEITYVVLSIRGPISSRAFGREGSSSLVRSERWRDETRREAPRSAHLLRRSRPPETKGSALPEATSGLRGAVQVRATC